MTADFILAARRLALYADTCAALLKHAGYAGKAQSLEAKAAAVLATMPPLGPQKEASAA